MKHLKKILAISLVALSLFAIALPALAATYGVVTVANLKVYNDIGGIPGTHIATAKLNDKIEFKSGSVMGTDGIVYVKVYFRNGAAAGTTGYVNQNGVKIVEY